MPRTIEIISPAHRTDDLVSRIRQIGGRSGLRVQREASLEPPGDVISIDAGSDALREVHGMLHEHQFLHDAGITVRTTEPLSILSPLSRRFVRDGSEATWEEAEFTIAKESNMTLNALLVMAIAGALAAIGIESNALHLVIGAMVIAPGFEPITRIALGAVAGGPSLIRGLLDTLKGYAALLVGAMIAALIMRMQNMNPLTGEATYFPPATLVTYWTQISGSSVVVSALAGLAGAVLIASHRSVLTAGVMIALALVPTFAIFGMGVVAGNFNIAAKGLLRWTIEVAMVFAAAVLVFLWKRLRQHRRPMMI